MQIISHPRGTWREHCISEARKPHHYESSSEVLPVWPAQLPEEPIKKQMLENISQELAICIL